MLFCVTCLSWKDTYSRITLLAVVCCCETRLTLEHLALTSTGFDGFNKSWVIDAIREPSFVDKVKGHLPSKIKLKAENGLIRKVEIQLETNFVYLYIVGPFPLCMFMQSNVIYQCQRSSEVKL